MSSLTCSGLARIRISIRHFNKGLPIITRDDSGHLWSDLLAVEATLSLSSVMTMTDHTSKWDVLVIGAGAAGLMSAAVAGQRGRRTLVLERNAQVGRKILISGGGRCNFTNKTVTHEHYQSANEHFSRSALGRYQPDDFVALLESYQIKYHEKTLGQLFCDDSARQVVQMLVEECERARVAINCEVEVDSISGDGPYTVQTNQGTYQSESLIVATGGLSIPKIGATDLGYRIARQYGLKVTELRPALVPFTFGDSVPIGFRSLSGTSVEAVASYGKQRFRENILFTHSGLSGPAILKVSLYWDPGQPVKIDFCPDTDAVDWLLTQKREHPKSTVRSALRRSLPQRLAQAFADSYCDTGDRPLAEIKSKRLEALGVQLNGWMITPAGTQGYKKAEVTRGGVATSELSSKTMEAKGAPGLFFIGEVVDVTGWLGGYNFQWAWASGTAAGQVA